jgi:hypothetical protein
MDQPPPDGVAPSDARAMAMHWAKIQALQATMDSFKGNEIKELQTFQSTGMPDCNHCNEGQANPSR